jgi:capsular polysaccharide biosynthesis protein
MIDCLPRIITLELSYPQRPIVILMPDSANEFQRATLESVLPPHFTIEYHHPDLWIRAERFLWASPASGLVNFFLPPVYFQQIRARVFGRYGLSSTHQMTRRIYLSRQRAKHRRVINDVALWQLLSAYGFELVELEELKFSEQVKLFHDCRILVGAHGAGLSTAIFSGAIDVVVLYSTKSPPNYFHTQTIALGQRHWHVCSDFQSEDADFIVNLDELKKVLDVSIGLPI